MLDHPVDHSEQVEHGGRVRVLGYFPVVDGEDDAVGVDGSSPADRLGVFLERGADHPPAAVEEQVHGVRAGRGRVVDHHRDGAVDRADLRHLTPRDGRTRKGELLEARVAASVRRGAERLR